MLNNLLDCDIVQLHACLRSSREYHNGAVVSLQTWRNSTGTIRERESFPLLFFSLFLPSFSSLSSLFLLFPLSAPQRFTKPQHGKIAEMIWGKGSARRLEVLVGMVP